MSSRSAKRPSASVPSPPPTARQQDHHNDTSPSEQGKQDYQDITAPQPRRSSRRTGTNSTGNAKGAAVVPTRANLEKMKESGIPASVALQKLEKKAKNSQVDAGHAREGLEDLELVLRRDTKRRKLQVETSIISSHSDDAEHAFRPRMPRGESMVLQTGQLLLTPERDTLDAEEESEKFAKEHDDPQEDAHEPPERGAKRAPAVNSDYLPLPWKGRLGYACLNTYLRAAKPPVFSSRTCRIASIIEHRYPLADPSQPEHATKNRPDKTKTPDVKRGQQWVEALGLANARDTVKMLQWNDKYGIKFMRLSSEMFPFASHEEYGYKLAPFASEVLAEVGKVAAKLGHRVTTHPGQFTQLGSPRKEVVNAAIRDLEYHDELLSLLKLPPQQDRDAVMILHMGGLFAESGGKPATLDRFRKNYVTLPEGIKRRLVLENDDVVWSVHDLLPICEELNIPLVLDYHHHNIVFDAEKIREGTFDISQPEISKRITDTWTRKNIKQKMHYSEQCPGTITPRERRKHSPRVATLPPCPPDVDLMIEAKDKEQAVFDLMRYFKLPGHECIADVVAHEREDQDRPAPPAKKPKKTAKKRKVKGEEPAAEEGAAAADEDTKPELDAPGALKVSSEEFGMGGPLGRVYWPVGFEEWLHPKKREKKVKVIEAKVDELED
ncbi:UV-damage endonuclease [Gnomoniopsis sp. IMI 355080]|nr:UV-damage endonuclease [Gnomoniopsis sp. IMI 355080]